MKKKALLLFSNGLDSLLAGKIIQSQGVEVIPITYATPFFNWKFYENPEYYQKFCITYGFNEGKVFDITEEYIKILKKPRYGFGCLANPCIACKILMLKKTNDLLKELKADFIITGEVIGQRPKSQNKKAMEIIKQESGAGELLVRPLSAKLLPPSLPEKLGWVDRDKLFAISGRNRKIQFELAKQFGIKKFSTPAGGCLLTDPEIGRRMLKILDLKKSLTPLTVRFSVLGRHFLDENFWIVLGRNHRENQKIFQLAKNIYPMFTLSVSAPIAVVLEGNQDLKMVKDLLIKFYKKAKEQMTLGHKVELVYPDEREFNSIQQEESKKVLLT